MRRRQGRTTVKTRCAVCRRWAFHPRGVYLEAIANGRTMCEGCGRFQLFCTCERADA